MGIEVEPMRRGVRAPASSAARKPSLSVAYIPGGQPVVLISTQGSLASFGLLLRIHEAQTAFSGSSGADPTSTWLRVD